MEVEFADEAEKWRTIFMYLSDDDDLRFKNLIKDMDPMEARGITKEGTDLSMLHWASLKGHFIIQNWLIDKMGFPPDLDDNNEIWSPAHVATITGQEKCLEALLMRKPEVINRPDKRGCTPVHLAAAHGRFHCLKYLLKNTRMLPNINKQCTRVRWTPLMYATWHGRISCVELLIRSGAVTDLTDIDGRLPLHLCAAEGHLTLVKYFLENGCSDPEKCLKAVDNHGFTPLELARINLKYDVCAYLENKTADPRTWEGEDNINFPGHVAALNGDLINIKALIEKGSIAVNDVDNKGYSMLHKAIVGNHFPVVKWLLHKGASMWIKTLGNETCLDIVRRKGNTKILNLLEHEEKKYRPIDKEKEGDRRIFIPLLSNLDSSSIESIDNMRWNELLLENKEEIINLEEKIIEGEKRLYDHQMEHNLKLSTGLDQESDQEYKKTSSIINHEILRLKYQLNVVKFNLYQLTKEPTPKEIEIGTALADCEHQYEEISDQLIYERLLREETEAELDRIRHQLLRLRESVLKNESPDALVSLVIEFDQFFTDRQNLEPIPKATVENKNNKYSLYFEINSKDKITISKVNYYLESKLIEETNIEDLTLRGFIKYIKAMLQNNVDNFRCKNQKKIKQHKKKLLSPKGGVFITNK